MHVIAVILLFQLFFDHAKSEYNTTLVHQASQSIQNLLNAVGSQMRVDSRDSDGSTPLITAAANGQFEAVQLLLSYWADIDAENNFGKTALSTAALNNDARIVKLLIRTGADVNAGTGTSPLLIAAQVDALNAATLLVLAKANVNQIDRLGNMPLNYAAGNGDTNFVDLLMSRNAHIDHHGFKGMTPLMSAAQKLQIETTKYLAHSGANVNAIDDNRNTPLLLAMSSNSSSSYYVALSLLDAGANVDSQNNEGYTALMLAAMKDDVDTVDLLLQRGANYSIEDNFGETALDLAKKLNFSDVISVLQSYLVQTNATQTPDIAREHPTSDNVNLTLTETRFPSANLTLEPSCKVPNVSFGLLTASSDENSWNATGVAPGTFVILSCEPGYFVVAPNIMTCQDDGTWSNKIGRCEKMWHLGQLYLVTENPDDNNNSTSA